MRERPREAIHSFVIPSGAGEACGVEESPSSRPRGLLYREACDSSTAALRAFARNDKVGDDFPRSFLRHSRLVAVGGSTAHGKSAESVHPAVSGFPLVIDACPRDIATPCRPTRNTVT